MKKLILLLLLICVGMLSGIRAQVVTVKSIQQVPLKENVRRATGKVAGISTNGKQVLLTDPGHRGLYRYTLLTKHAKCLSSDAGAGYRVAVGKRCAVPQTHPKPFGEGAGYLWTSVSPDGERFLFYVSGYGAFVCRMDGSELQSIGELHAAQWLTNDIIVAMQDEDDGLMVTASTIVVYDLLTGKQQVLTDAALKMMYPYADGKGKTIACSTDGGDLYLIKLK